MSKKLILHELVATPERTVFIDDSKANIEAARLIGMTGILFTTAEHLRDELVRLNIL